MFSRKSDQQEMFEQFRRQETGYVFKEKRPTADEPKKLISQIQNEPKTITSSPTHTPLKPGPSSEMTSSHDNAPIVFSWEEKV